MLRISYSMFGFNRCMIIKYKFSGKRRIFCSLLSENSLQYHAISYQEESLLSSLLAALRSSSSVSCCRVIHARVIKSLDYRDGFIGDQMVSSYINMGFIGDADKLFDEIPHRDLVSWNSLISGSSRRGLVAKCLSVFSRMKSELGLELNELTLISTISACTSGKALDGGQYLHGCAVKLGMELEAKVVNSLISMYGKFGCLDSAFKLFMEMPERTMVSWNSMVAICAQNGIPEEAINYFKMMKRLCHAWTWKRSNRILRKNSKRRVQPRLDHYSCMVDLLGRCGLLDEAHELIKHMPLEPNSGVWGALLGACRVYGNIDLGLWADASKVRASMKTKGLVRNPGCSFIEHGNKIHRFVVDDHSHPDSEKIHEKLEEMIRKIQEAGFVSETESVLHDVDEEVKTNMINKHSEKIALAYGLLVTNADMPLVIMKNLRICSDCHNTAKFVSLIEKRTIIIQDIKRFHHFMDGVCSCGDYW